MLQLMPGTTSRYRRGSSVARDQIEGAPAQRGTAGSCRARSNPRGSVRVGRRGSSHVSSLVLEAPDRNEGATAVSDIHKQEPKLCHEGTVNSVFRDPKDAGHVVSAGDDGHIKWCAFGFRGGATGRAALPLYTCAEGRGPQLFTDL